MKTKDILEIVRYGCAIWKEAQKELAMEPDEVIEKLDQTKERLHVSSGLVFSDKVLNIFSSSIQTINRVNGVMHHMYGVFYSQNDIAWESKKS